MIAAEAKFGGGEQPIDDIVVLACTIVDELGTTLGTEDEERRHLALANAARKLDEDLGAIVEGAQRPPSRRVAFDRVPEIEPGEVEPGRRRERRLRRPRYAGASAMSWSCGYCQETEAM